MDAGQFKRDTLGDHIFDHFLDQLKAVGFSGIQNFPTVGLIDGLFRQNLEETGMGYGPEVEMIRTANTLLDDAGISLDSDPRRVAKSGSAQDAAQMAAIEIAATGAAMLPRAEPATTPQQG